MIETLKLIHDGRWSEISFAALAELQASGHVTIKDGTIDLTPMAMDYLYGLKLTRETVVRKLIGRGLIYLASPYSHSSKRIMRQRVMATAELAAYLMDAGVIVFAPIPKAAEISFHLPHWEHRHWLDFDMEFVARSNAMVVHALPGWEQSKGVKEEIEFCRNREIPVYYLEEEL